MRAENRSDGVTLIAIYYFFFAAVNLIGSLAMFVYVIRPTLVYRGGWGLDLMSSIFGVGIVFLFAVAGALLGLAEGFGLLRQRNWARILAIVLAFPTLLVIPIGTAIGALIIRYLLRQDVRTVFEAAVK